MYIFVAVPVIFWT